MVAFLKERDEPGGPSAYLSITANSLYLGKIGIYTMQTMIGDSFMVCLSSYWQCRSKHIDALGISHVYCLGQRQTSSRRILNIAYSEPG